MRKFIENRKQLLQMQGERIENLRRKIKNTDQFELYADLYIKLVIEASSVSESYRILVDEILSTIYGICIQRSLLSWPEIVSEIEIENQVFKLDEIAIKENIESIYGGFLDSTNFELIAEYSRYGERGRDMQKLYLLAEEMIKLQGHPLTLDDLHSVFEDVDIYRRMPYEDANQVLMRLADIEIIKGPAMKATEIEEENDAPSDDFEDYLYVNGKKYDFRELPELILPGTKKHYETLKISCKDLESGFQQIRKLGINQMEEIYEQTNKYIKKMDEKLKKSPPPKTSDFNKELEEVAKLRTINSKLKLWNLNPKLFSVLKNHYFGEDEEQELYEYRFYDLTVRIPWKYKVSYKIKDKRMEEQFSKQDLEYKDVLRRIKKIKVLDDKSHIILKRLDQMDPEFQVYLPRLAELVEMQLEETEETLVYVLQKHPQIGKYDEMSQMLRFSKPDDVSELIDKLLKKYEIITEKKE